MTETPDQRADRLACIATELVVRVRDDDPVDVHRWLANVVPAVDLPALAIVLAAAVPDNRSWLTLTAWTRHPASHLTAA